jgi:glycosyltransferase involved in cell wall biosynthesis
MVSNQFHRHKNHKTVFEAMATLKRQGVPIHLAVTGRLPLDPASAYLKELQEILKKNQLGDTISLLGLIPREEQLLLMRQAKAIIQPSLFEGWSTVIEDARSLQVPVIASDIDVNREQLGDTGFYFPPHNSDTLVRRMKAISNRQFMRDLYEPYELRMKRAAYELLGIFRKIR